MILLYALAKSEKADFARAFLYFGNISFRLYIVDNDYRT